MSSTSTDAPGGAGRKKANIVVIGAGWWAQGWHLPQLSRNESATIAAIVDQSPHPKSNLNPNLESLSVLADKYGCPIFSSVTELLGHPDIGGEIDGFIVCTPHSTHYEVGELLLKEGVRRKKEGGKPIHVLMEKPMTTNVHQAKKLHDLVQDYQSVDGGGCFLVNHSANFREQTRVARELVRSGKIGRIKHISGLMASPLSWLFDDPSNKNWNEPDDSGTMLGNGFAWGQSSHLLAWIYHVGDICPKRVYCAMNHSEKTGADVSHAATIHCGDGVTFSLSGTSLLPGYEHSDPPVGKKIRVEIFGSDGAIVYNGDDRDPRSGRLELFKGGDGHGAGSVEVLCENLGFHFENCESQGNGPESLQNFLSACRGIEYHYVGADSTVGLKTVQTIDAMYRSHASGNAENVVYS